LVGFMTEFILYSLIKFADWKIVERVGTGSWA